MTEEVQELKTAIAKLQGALQEAAKQKDERIKELEQQLLKERLRTLELEKRRAKNS